MALKELVLDGLVIPSQTPSGIVYQVTPTGKEYCESLDSDYAKEYKMIAKKVVQAVDGKSERSVIAKINRLSAASLKEANK